MATVDLGKLAFVNKGTWSSATAYAVRDVVQHTHHNETSTYLAVQASTNQAPSTNGTINTSNWSLAKGTTLASNNQGTYNVERLMKKAMWSNILIAELLRLFFTSILRLHQDKYLQHQER